VSVVSSTDNETSLASGKKRDGGGMSFGGDGVTSDVKLGVPRKVCYFDGVILVTHNVGERNVCVE
jgi:hypothetical protein